MRRKKTRLLLLPAALVAVAVVAATVTTALTWAPPHPPAPGCTVRAGSATYRLETEQAANAATIAAVGKRRGMPDHAVTVALATAMQESRLYNLPHGDRDSLGLFQQRPSQGWGSPRQVLDPQYAAAKFYEKLARIPGWQSMPVTAAAQAVQRSAAGDAYAQWEPQATLLAVALTGEVPAGLTCRFPGGTADPAGANALSRDLTAELGPNALDAVVSPARGWTIASWLVAHADSYGLASVSFGGKTWRRTTALWAADGVPENRVRVRPLSVSAAGS